MHHLVIPFKGHRIELFDRPGEWMDDNTLQALSQRLVAMVDDRLGDQMHRGHFQGRDNLSQKLILISRNRKTGADEACVLLAYLGTYEGNLAVHLGFTLSKSETKGLMQWLYFVATGWVLVQNGFFRRTWFTSITHAPRIFGSVADYYRDVFPGLDADARPQPFHHALCEMLRRDYVQRQRGTATPPAMDERFVLVGFRARPDGGLWIGDTWDTIPLHRNPAYNDRLRDLLNLARGDDVLQAGWLSGPAWLRLLSSARLVTKG